MSSNKIAIGCDHAGYETKEAVAKTLRGKGYEIKDFGTFSLDSVDYPDFAHAVANAVENKEAEYGVLFCGSANGVAISANRHHDVRAAIAWRNDVAALAR